MKQRSFCHAIRSYCLVFLLFAFYNSGISQLPCHYDATNYKVPKKERLNLKSTPPFVTINLQIIAVQDHNGNNGIVGDKR